MKSFRRQLAVSCLSRASHCRALAPAGSHGYAKRRLRRVPPPERRGELQRLAAARCAFPVRKRSLESGYSGSTEPQRPRDNGSNSKQFEMRPRIVVEPVTDRFYAICAHHK